MDPVWVKLAKVTLVSFFTAVFAHPEQLETVVPLLVCILLVESRQAVVEKTAWGRPVPAEVEAEHRFIAEGPIKANLLQIRCHELIADQVLHVRSLLLHLLLLII